MALALPLTGPSQELRRPGHTHSIIYRNRVRYGPVADAFEIVEFLGTSQVGSWNFALIGSAQWEAQAGPPAFLLTKIRRQFTELEAIPLDTPPQLRQFARMELSLANAVTALIALNFVAFAAFGIDKAKAASGARRIAESTLLWLAMLGGTVGAYAGRALFRHKTRKQPFSVYLHAIAVLQSLTLGGGLVWYLMRFA